MCNWQSTVVESVLSAVAGDSFWENHLRQIVFDDTSPIGLHLAVFIEPYLRYILEEKKTIESRFSVHRRAPYGQIAAGDIVFLKRSGGPVVGLCLVSNVWFYNLDAASWHSLRTDFAQALCAQDPEFWETRKNASFATLMRLSTVTPIDPILIPKRDRRGWVVLRTTLSGSDNKVLFQ